ncbi:predicted protein [Arabidopsis lyrata subsp. lyrata]|uniref:Predicted protein n=1 Tax=Arabidopsis lyrata subsp. lyrata TaxID=81972 RepID=D7KSG8_ARALL|nr:predicted protein [Arabidopsis lyrata subsp. lyrata]
MHANKWRVVLDKWRTTRHIANGTPTHVATETTLVATRTTLVATQMTSVEEFN